jgi:phosphotransferase system enzyme I (PtsP)
MQAAASSTVSRRLLGRLRDVMAAGGTAQQRLDQVVKLIAADMVAEVCSCYVMRAGEVLELFATEGLLKTAVHETRLRVGEGLVGDIAARARTLALSDAQSHPNFAYRPETGEEIFHSLIGVPIIRGGRVIGVLVVQNKTSRHYTEEEGETLETVAMVLAELVSSGELIGRDELAPVDGNALLPLRLEGAKLTGGIGIGVAVMHEPQIIIEKLVSEDPDIERDRLRNAMSQMRRSLEEMFEAQDLALSGEHRDLLETYRMFAEDAGWTARITEAIKSGLTAEAAVQKVHEDTRVRMAQVSDPYLRERLHDFEDIANRLLSHLVGRPVGSAAQSDLPDNTVLVCRSLGPTELLDYDRKKLRALVLEEGSPTLHVAILARALDIPMIGRVPDALRKINGGDPVVVDADNGQIFVRPTDDILDAYALNQTARAERVAQFAAMRDLPAVTACGQKVKLLINAGLLVDVPQMHAAGADGVGLYRTEMPFMSRPYMPDVAAQRALYSNILEQAEPLPVTFRTLDVGSDKLLPYWHAEREDNPALGWRSIRISLDRPAVLRQQLRALLQAGSGRRLHLMFPMVAEVAELDRLRSILALEQRHQSGQGVAPPAELKVGVMLEVPALAWQLPALFERVDFISVGSNDLTQFMFAIDRGNPRIADRYDVLSPGMLSFLCWIADACRVSGVTLSVCGEMAGRPLEAMALLGVGIRALSMSAPQIGPVKAMLRSLDLAPLQHFMQGLYGRPDHSVREELRHFARDHGVQI